MSLELRLQVRGVVECQQMADLDIAE